MVSRARVVVGGVVGSLVLWGLVAVPGVEALTFPGWSGGVVAVDGGGVSSLGVDTDRPVGRGVWGSGVVGGGVGLPSPVGSGSVASLSARGAGSFDSASARVVGRGERFTDFVDASGLGRRVLTMDVSNFQDSAGVWRAVDSTLVADPGNPGVVVSKANAWQARFGDAGQGVSWQSSAGSVTLVPVGGSPVGVSKSGAMASYRGVWPGVDMSYDVSGSGVKGTLILSSPEVPNSFEFQVRSGVGPGLVKGSGARVSLQGVVVDKEGYLPLDRAGIPGLRVEPPLVVRADGAPVVEAKAQLSISKEGNVVVLVDRGWLRS